MENAPEQSDIVVSLLGRLDHALDLVHDKVLRPIIVVGRFLAFSFLIALCLFVLVVALLVGVTRLIDVYAFPGRVWATYFLLAFGFFVAGAFCWRLRAPVKTRK